MLYAAMAALLITSLLALVRASLGPTVFDRILAVNMFGTKTVLLIAVIGYLTNRPDFLDIALLYALMNFIGMICVLKYFHYDSLADAAPQEETKEGAASHAP